MDSVPSTSAAQRDRRTLSLIGPQALEALRCANVLVVGLGGVGGYAAEILARTAVGHMTIVDADTVDPSNINRQIIADITTVGKLKTELFAARLTAINPDLEIKTFPHYVTPESVPQLLASARFDFVIDAIDTVAPKCALIAGAVERRIPIVSAMGAGGRTDPARVCISDLWQTRDDGLARAVRTRLKKMGLRRALPVVCSTEPPRHEALVDVNTDNKRTSFGTTAIVPSTFGIFLASYVINRITRI